MKPADAFDEILKLQEFISLCFKDLYTDDDGYARRVVGDEVDRETVILPSEIVAGIIPDCEFIVWYNR